MYRYSLIPIHYFFCKEQQEREREVYTNKHNKHYSYFDTIFFLLFTKKTKKLIFSHFLKITASFNIHNIPFLTPNNRTL